ncbi:hypothetical protein Pcinc_004469 [Petrolisthes cinctipes]|uniref:Uncharacterized protein n=1 Tax=Petrolisthes cinctipes TaxID=88211 RepID=A0AAE1GLC5_PETCI|nr:hypothetical protein Pcinc_004469 [Petrolisthes cinctipes]
MVPGLEVISTSYLMVTHRLPRVSCCMTCFTQHPGPLPPQAEGHLVLVSQQQLPQTRKHGTGGLLPPCPPWSAQKPSTSNQPLP